MSSLGSLSGGEQLAVGTRDPAKKSRRRKSKSGVKLKKPREVLINDQEYEEIDDLKPVSVTGLSFSVTFCLFFFLNMFLGSVSL